MNRLAILATAISVTAIGVGKFVVDPPVNLQATTPGTQQVGNINVSGAVLAGTFFGSSSGTTTKVVSGWATSTTGFVFGGDFRSASTDGRGVFGSATAANGFTYGGDFRSASPNGRGIFGYATSTSGQGIGGEFRSDSPLGFGIIGKSMATSGTGVGGSFTSFGNSGVGVEGVAQGGTGQTKGGSFTTFSPVGMGIKATSVNVTGINYAGFFSSSTTDSNASTGYFAQFATGDASVTALSAIVSAADGGGSRGLLADGRSGYGVYARANGPSGYGLYAEGTSLGINGFSITGVGVKGQTSEANSYGVIGQAPVGGTGHALFASGTFAATGTKALKIDYPDDPENKYLIQYCAEGDTPQLQYRGMVKLDSNGGASIALPEYFDKINRDPTYQLTPVGAAMPGLYVSQKVTKNEFKIAGGKAGAEVSWTVIGIRNDRFVQKYGAPNVQDKPDNFRGTYLSPELYNKPTELQQGFTDKDRARMQNSQPVASNNRARK